MLPLYSRSSPPSWIPPPLTLPWSSLATWAIWAPFSVPGSGRDVFPFMLEGGALLTPETCPRSSCYTLVFGNEATGLPPEFRQYGQPLFIAQSPDVDSLNLAVAVAVGAWIFKSKNGGILS